MNTLRVVNAGSSKGDAVFVYDLTYKTLYYSYGCFATYGSYGLNLKLN